jgi:hypothetical protein
LPNELIDQGRTKCYDTRVSAKPLGLFQTPTEFVLYLISRVQGLAGPQRLEMVQKNLTKTFNNIFTHADFAPRNILINGGHVVAIVDWEQSGFYPEYWEYVKAMLGDGGRDGEFWKDYLPAFMTVYVTEQEADAVLQDLEGPLPM